MRILVDARHLTSPRPSGVGNYTLHLLHALFALGSDYTFTLLTTGSSAISPLTKGGLGRVAVGNIVHRRIPNKLLAACMLATGQPTLDQLAGDRFDLLFLPNLNITAIPKNLPYVLTIHDASWELYPHFYSRKMLAWHALCRPRALIKNARSIICPSQNTKDDLVRLFHKSPETIHVIPHGVDKSFSDKLEPQDYGVRSRHKLPRRFALFVGTLEPRKNLLTLLDGLEAYRASSRDDLHLVLAGSMGWKSRALERRLREETIRPWTHHLSYVPRTDLPALYRAAECFIWPSFHEGFGLPVLEAMASGTPIITSYTSSLPELTGTAAIHIDPYNHRDIAVALRELLTSPSLQDRLRATGLERAKRFTWSQTAAATLDVFKGV